jgi:N-glycosylase/DNA lyase
MVVRVWLLAVAGQGIHYRSLFRGSDAAAHAEDLQHDTTLAFIRRYFALDVSLPELYSFWSARDPNFAKKTASGTRYGGIRILRQPAWECLIEFICSSNNNIARIEGMVKRFSQLYGQRLPAPSEVEQLGQGLDAEDTSNAKPELDEGTGLAPPTTKAEDLANPLELEEAEEVYSFPRPQDLLGEGTTAALRAAGFGYRDAYVAKTAALVCELATEAGQGNEPEAWLESISALSEQDAREALLRFSGVGPKVADCILLFGLGFGEVVPVDTHVYQIAVRDYGLKGSRDATVNRAMYAKVNDKLRGVWEDKAGWAHQVRSACLTLKRWHMTKGALLL